MSDTIRTFTVSWDECVRIKPLMKTQTEPMEIEGAPPGKWWLKKIEIELVPVTGITVAVTARLADID